MTGAESTALAKPRVRISRDEVVLGLGELVRKHPKPAAAAGQRVADRIDAYVCAENARAREQARRTRALLSVAHRLALEPDCMRAVTDRPLRGVRALKDAEGRPMHLDRPQPEFLLQAAEAVGHWDDNLADEVENLAGWLDGARTGAFGEYRASKKIDLRAVDPVDAYVHARTVKLKQPGEPALERGSPEDFRAALDPVRARSLAATPCCAVDSLVADEMRSTRSTTRTSAAWWETAALVLTVADGTFDPRGIGIPLDAGWLHADDGSMVDAVSRTMVRDVVLLRRKHDPDDRMRHAKFWRMAHRAWRWLSHRAKRDGEQGRIEPATGTNSSLSPTPPLGETARAIFEELCSLPGERAVSARHLVAAVTRRTGGRVVTEDAIRAHVNRYGTRWGVAKAGKSGYYIPLDRRYGEVTQESR